MNLKEQLEAIEKEFGADSRKDYKKDYFVFEKGENRIRILTEWVPIVSHYLGGKYITCVGEEGGCPYHGENTPLDEKGNPMRARMRFVTYVLSKGEILLAFLPYSVIRSLVDLTDSPDWAFERFPMPYDITIMYDPDEAPVNKYKVVPSPRREEVPDEYKKLLAEKRSIHEVVERIKEKQATIKES